MRQTTALVLALVVTASPSLAEDPELKGPPAREEAHSGATTPAPGVAPADHRVRVKLARGYEHVARGQLYGKVLSFDDRAMTFEIASGQRLEIPTAAVDKIEIYRGKHPRSRGALYGALAGGAITGAISAGGWATCGENCLGVGLWTVYVIPVAMVGGALLGLAATPNERWEKVTPRELKVQVTPMIHPRGAGVVVSF